MLIWCVESFNSLVEISSCPELLIDFYFCNIKNTMDIDRIYICKNILLDSEGGI